VKYEMATRARSTSGRTHFAPPSVKKEEIVAITKAKVTPA
jgi:hypothetical protein